MPQWQAGCGGGDWGNTRVQKPGSLILDSVAPRDERASLAEAGAGALPGDRLRSREARVAARHSGTDSMTPMWRYLSAILMLAATSLSAETYYVDSARGDDANAGTRAAQAWRSLEAVNGRELAPGDEVRFVAGGVWRGTLAPRGRGAAGRPVLLGRYGDGARPRIEGTDEDAVRLRNFPHAVLESLEITNRGDGDRPRRGVHVVAENVGTVAGVVVRDLYVHDVNGTNQQKDNGGIIFHTRGDAQPSRFDGLRIERNVRVARGPQRDRRPERPLTAPPLVPVPERRHPRQLRGRHGRRRDRAVGDRRCRWWSTTSFAAPTCGRATTTPASGRGAPTAPSSASTAPPGSSDDARRPRLRQRLQLPGHPLRVQPEPRQRRGASC